MQRHPVDLIAEQRAAIGDAELTATVVAVGIGVGARS
jgi:hypothetical protein